MLSPNMVTSFLQNIIQTCIVEFSITRHHTIEINQSISFRENANHPLLHCQFISQTAERHTWCKFTCNKTGRNCFNTSDHWLCLCSDNICSFNRILRPINFPSFLLDILVRNFICIGNDWFLKYQKLSHSKTAQFWKPLFWKRQSITSQVDSCSKGDTVHPFIIKLQTDWMCIYIHEHPLNEGYPVSQLSFESCHWELVQPKHLQICNEFKQDINTTNQVITTSCTLSGNQALIIMQKLSVRIQKAVQFRNQITPPFIHFIKTTKMH